MDGDGGRSREAAPHGESQDLAARALTELLDALEATEQLLVVTRRRGREVQEGLDAGLRWRDVVTDDNRPLIVEMLTDSLQRLMDAGSVFRREEARVLHDEGLTMEAIASLFGVTRQRISHLLRAGPAPDDQAARVTNRRNRPSSRSISAAMSETD